MTEHQDNPKLGTGTWALIGLGVAGVLWLLLRKPKAASLKAPPLELKKTTWQPKAPLPQYAEPPRTNAEMSARLSFLKKVRPDAASHADGYSQHSWMYAQASNQYGPVGYFTLKEVEQYNTALQEAWNQNKPVPAYPGLPNYKLPNHYGNDGTPKFGETANKMAWLSYKLTSGVAGFSQDEYGRFYKGVPGDPLGTLLTTAKIAAPFVPGIGPAAAAALAGVIALGQGKSLKDAALEAAKAALPGGPLAEMGFNAAIAVASGEPVDEAVMNTFFEKYPQAKAGYEAGLKAYKQAKS